MSEDKQIISRYITELFATEDESLKRVREDTTRKGLPTIAVKAEEGRFLQFLVRGCNVSKAVEIGTLGGYSGIWIARGLAPGGKLITLEKDPHHAEVAREHFISAGVSERVEIWVGAAHKSLRLLSNEGMFDFVFIDAEKSGYQAYFDWALENVRVGAIIAAHNALRRGRVAGIGVADAHTSEMRSFNKNVASEPRVISTIYPGGDGTLVAVKIA